MKQRNLAHNRHHDCLRMPISQRWPQTGRASTGGLLPTQTSTQAWHTLVAAMMAAQETERARIADTLHDDLVQSLAGICLGLDRVQRLLNGDRIQVSQQVAAVRATAAELIQVARSVIADVRPPALAELGLVPAIEVLLHTHPVDGVTTAVAVHGAVRRLDPDRELAIFRIVQEAWTHICCRVQATIATITLAFQPMALTVTIRDDGQVVTPSILAAGGWWGMFEMRERARLVGGTLTVTSAAGAGTVVTITIPYPDVRD